MESTPVSNVTLEELALDTAPVTRGLLDTILLSDIPLDGGWSAKLRPGGPLLVEQTITLLDVYTDPAFRPALATVTLGDLGLQASTLGSISTYAALLAGVPVTQLPVPGAGDATAFWCDLVRDTGLDCASDFGPEPLTLPVLSFAGVDVEQADFLGALIDGATGLTGTPIGSTQLGELNIGAVPLASQPLVPSKSLPWSPRRLWTYRPCSRTSRWENSAKRPRSARSRRRTSISTAPTTSRFSISNSSPTRHWPTTRGWPRQRVQACS